MQFSSEEKMINEESTVQVTAKTLPIVHWFVASELIGQSGCSLLWVARENVNASALD